MDGGVALAPASGTSTSNYLPGNVMWELPKLEEPGEDSALKCAEWLTSIGPYMSDLAPMSGSWWEGVVKHCTGIYKLWQKADVIDRAQMECYVPVEYDNDRYRRLESRGIAMLFKALPDSLQRELVATGKMTTCAALWRVTCLYQPGGSAERAYLLKMLTSPPKAVGAHRALQEIRTWFRHFDRAVAMGIQVPDASLLLSAIDSFGAFKDPSAAYRTQVARHSLAVDSRPTVDSVHRYAKAVSYTHLRAHET